MPTDAKEIKRKIIEVFKQKGPCLPVHIAKEIQMSSLFAGAFLSELASEREVKISNMKVGGSPLYFLQGQEEMLEKFYTYIPGKEKEAFILLKERRILKDSRQEPAIRVALRAIKDFAFPFHKDNEIFWRFHSVSEQEVRERLEPIIKAEAIQVEQARKTEQKIEPIKIKIEPKPAELKKEIEPIKKIKIIKEKRKEPKTKLEPIFEKRPVKAQTVKKEKEIEKSDFIMRVIEFLKKENIEILEEKEIKKKDYSSKVLVESNLGKMTFFCVAKDKKSISEDDLRLILQKSQAIRMPALIVFPGKIDKKAQDYAEKWSSLLKFKKLE